MKILMDVSEATEICKDRNRQLSASALLNKSSGHPEGVTRRENKRKSLRAAAVYGLYRKVTRTASFYRIYLKRKRTRQPPETPIYGYLQPRRRHHCVAGLLGRIKWYLVVEEMGKWSEHREALFDVTVTNACRRRIFLRIERSTEHFKKSKSARTTSEQVYRSGGARLRPLGPLRGRERYLSSALLFLMEPPHSRSRRRGARAADGVTLAAGECFRSRVRLWMGDFELYERRNKRSAGTLANVGRPVFLFAAADLKPWTINVTETTLIPSEIADVRIIGGPHAANVMLAWAFH
ncbi:hypothetical protein EVAR_93639_1 [Eumeta japonica]|uniref:Uncharacterized protein n=1 Tax=Eumeta variegata TaxID=151549 RepID=A0A4C1TQK2_EUMVA|nr:hypothetical protein EVAR_93639_1 [Eumeta japonica]